MTGKITSAAIAVGQTKLERLLRRIVFLLFVIFQFDQIGFLPPVLTCTDQTHFFETSNQNRICEFAWSLVRNLKLCNVCISLDTHYLIGGGTHLNDHLSGATLLGLDGILPIGVRHQSGCHDASAALDCCFLPFCKHQPKVFSAPALGP